MFFQGSVPEAIQISKQLLKPLIVFLKGDDEVSEAVETTLQSAELKEITEQSLILRLEDKLEDTPDSRFNNGRMFRQLYPVNQLPAVLVLGVDGPAIVMVKGKSETQELKDKLKEGVEVYKKQVAKKTQSQETTSQSLPPQPSSSTTSIAVQPAVQPEVVSTPPVQKKKKQVVKQPPAPPPVYHTALIRFRLTNDEFIEHEFAADATIREVCSFLDIHRTDGHEPYVLEMLYPRQALGEDKYTKTLKELDLVPRSTIRLTLVKGAKIMRTAVAANTDGGWLTSLWYFLEAAWGFINPWSFFESISPTYQRPQNPQSAPSTSSAEQPISHTSTSSSGVRKRPGWGNNVASIHDPDDEDSEKRTAYWNGNSTQYDGDSHEH